MDKQEGRRIIKGLQAITNFRGDSEAEKVLEEVAAFVSQNTTTKSAPIVEDAPEAPKKSKRGYK